MWWCPNCNCERAPYHVTFEEKCDYCGADVEWIEEETDDERTGMN